MHQARDRLLQFLCCLLVLAGLSASAIRGQGSVDDSSAGPGSGQNTPAPGAGSLPPSPGSSAIGPAPKATAGKDGSGASAAQDQTGGAGQADGLKAGDAGSNASVKGAPVVASTESGPAGPPGTWKLVFDEEFDVLNTAVWTPYWFKDCDSDSMKNGVKTCASNVTIENGNAVLKLSDAGSGALLSTNPKDGVPGHVGFQYTTGYVEARIFFPGTCSGGINNWPAWWTVGQNFPATGEIDIAEPLAGDMSTVYHSPVTAMAKGILGCWAGGYHTYGVHRKAGVNDIYFDGRLVSSYPTQDNNAPHYLLLNVGLYPQKRIFGEASAVRVDWVRAWE